MMPCARRRWDKACAALPAAAVSIDIEAEINGARAVAQLLKLVSGEMRAQPNRWRGGNLPATRPRDQTCLRQITLGNWRTDSQANKSPLVPGRKRWAKAVPMLRPYKFTMRPSWQQGKTTR